MSLEIIKEPKKLYEFLRISDEFYSEKIPEHIAIKINKAKSKERDVPTYLWSKNNYH